ncbi:MAG TPA: hypothetical protein DCM40_28515, partial [Maribacter sp.]|nr:hypothetical protein [Maribacter sp.]
MAERLTQGGKKSVGFFGKMRVAAKGAATAMKGLFAKLTDPVVIIGGIVGGLKALYNIQSRVFKQNAAAMKATEGHYGGGIMRGLENQRQLTEDITKNIGALNTELGFVATKGLGEVNRGMEILTEYFGLSTGEARNLFALSAQTGVSFTEISQEIGAATGSLEAQTGYAVSVNKMMRTIANSSATARFNFQGSKEQMMQAGYYASLLGMSIDDINSVARKTLDFEDSIASEIEAELMLNKDLNLEKLRYAALTGDSATQASELQRLVKENYKGLKGNVLAQEAFAKAAGISTDQVAQAVENMELSKEFGADSVDIQNAMNKLMAKGLTEEEALAKIKKDGVKSTIAALDAEKKRANQWKFLIRKIQDAFLPLANKIFGKNGENISAFISKAEQVAKTVASVVSKFVDYAKEIAILVGALGAFKLGKTIYDAFFERGSMANPTYVIPLGGGFGGPGSGGPGGMMPYGADDGGGNQKNKKNTKRNNKKSPKSNRSRSNKGGGRNRSRGRGRGRARGLLGLTALIGGGYLANKAFSGSDEPSPSGGGGGGGGTLDYSGESLSGDVSPGAVPNENFRKGPGAMDYGTGAGSFTIGGKEPGFDAGGEPTTFNMSDSGGGASPTGGPQNLANNLSQDQKLDMRADAQDIGMNTGPLSTEQYGQIAMADLAFGGVQKLMNSKLVTNMMAPFSNIKNNIAKSKPVQNLSKRTFNLADKFKGYMNKGGDFLKSLSPAKFMNKKFSQATDFIKGMRTDPAKTMAAG